MPRRGEPRLLGLDDTEFESRLRDSTQQLTERLVVMPLNVQAIRIVHLCSADRVPRPVEGVGQKACTAFWDNGTQGCTVIRFVAKAHLFSIEIHYRAADVADYPADKAVALANLVVANLG